MRKLLAVCVLTLCMVAATFGIECYTCNSTTSSQECVKRQKLQSCPSNQDQCRTSFITLKTGRYDKKQFLKQCSSKAVCDQQAKNTTALCKEHNGTCLERCCSHDSCNKMDGGPRTVTCYQCFSEKSWDDCDRVRKVVSCFVDEQEKCAKSVFTGKRGDQTIKVYAKLCLSRPSCHYDSCEAKLPDQSIRITNCDGTSCCSKDLCNENGAKVPMVSSIILLICVLQAVVH